MTGAEQLNSFLGDIFGRINKIEERTMAEGLGSAVSITEIDVYKRQVYTGNGSASSFFFRKIKNVLCRKLSTGLEEIQASDPSAHRSFSKARFSMRDT